VAEAQHQRVQAEGLQKALQSLDDRSRAIVMARWLADSDDKAPTLHELADRYGISAERVRQIEGQAFKKLRSLISETA
jgi:RNA polymerase sigma-32 factor